MKLWFIEPRPNIFVSGIKDSAAEDVVRFLYKHCPIESGLLMIRSVRESPGFALQCVGPPRKPMIEVSGLQLIVETLKTGKPQHLVRSV